MNSENREIKQDYGPIHFSDVNIRHDHYVILPILKTNFSPKEAMTVIFKSTWHFNYE